MPSTLKYSLTYPSGTAAPNVPLVMQTSMESVEAALTGVDNKIRHAEYTSALVGLTAGIGRDVGAFTVVTGVTFNNTFVTPDVAGKVKITEAGVYAVDFTALPSTSPGTISIQIMGNTLVRVAQAVGGNYGAWEVTTSAANVYIPANEVLNFNVVCNNAINVGSRIRISKLHG